MEGTLTLQVNDKYNDGITEIIVRPTTKIYQIVHAYFSRLGKSIDIEDCTILNARNDIFDTSKLVSECGFQDREMLKILV
jgi:hypothetical protein